MSNVIEVKDLNKNFRTRLRGTGLKGTLTSLVKPHYKVTEAVSSLNFNVNKGEILAFIGPNGAGKSTTIKLITGILYPDSGEISVLGMNPHKHRKQLAYKIGTVFGQKSQLWFHLAPKDSFKLLGTIYDLSPKMIDTRMEELKEIFELHEFFDQPVRKLSLGQRIRCEIAASMLHEPELLFLDEPSIGLDVVVKQRIRDLISRLNEEKDVTIFLTSHDAGDIEKICKRAMVINHGNLVWDGSIKEMKYNLLNHRIIDLKLGEPLDFQMKGVSIIKSSAYSAKLEVDLNSISVEKTIQQLMENNKIADMTISNPPMEEVITHIYGGVK